MSTSKQLRLGDQNIIVITNNRFCYQNVTLIVDDRIKIECLRSAQKLLKSFINSTKNTNAKPTCKRFENRSGMNAGENAKRTYNEKYQRKRFIDIMSTKCITKPICQKLMVITAGRQRIAFDNEFYIVNIKMFLTFEEAFAPNRYAS